MIPKRYRLKNTKAFDATYKNRCVVSDSLFTFYIGKTKKSPEVSTKFGFVVSKKYHKRAVKRNRIKRLMRESIRLSIKENRMGALENHMSFVVLPKLNAQNLKLADVQKSFTNIIARIK